MAQNFLPSDANPGIRRFRQLSSHLLISFITLLIKAIVHKQRGNMETRASCRPWSTKCRLVKPMPPNQGKKHEETSRQAFLARPLRRGVRFVCVGAHCGLQVTRRTKVPWSRPAKRPEACQSALPSIQLNEIRMNLLLTGWAGGAAVHERRCSDRPS